MIGDESASTISINNNSKQLDILILYYWVTIHMYIIIIIICIARGYYGLHNIILSMYIHISDSEFEVVKLFIFLLCVYQQAYQQ